MNNQSITSFEVSQPPVEDSRRRQLIEVTIDSLAELGYVGTTLAQIASRAEVSPGLVAHYFGDKDSLLDAAFRALFPPNVGGKTGPKLSVAGGLTFCVSASVSL